MPTYTVTSVNVALSEVQKAEIADAITTAHHDGTGAPRFFAQVLFRALAGSDHFLGGRPNTSPHIFVHGLIRAGRDTAAKQDVMERVVARVTEIAGVGREDVWMYIQDIDAAQMIEYGRTLPEPGSEEAWLSGVTGRKRAELERDGVGI